MKTPKSPLLLMGLLLLGSTLAGQQGGSEGDAITIEELYLQNAEIRLIRELALTQDRGIKLLALENIQTMLDEGKLSTGAPEAHFILDYLAAEGLTRTVREANRLVNYFPEVRRRAVNLLGQLGGQQATDTLVGVLTTDDEPMVLAEAAYALGTIGDNEDNRTSQSLASVVIAQDTVAPDNNFAFASLLAFEKIAQANNGINDVLAFEAIFAHDIVL